MKGKFGTFKSPRTSMPSVLCYNRRFSAHDQSTMGAQPVCLLWDVVRGALDVGVASIDEGKFPPDLEFCKVMVSVGKTVIVGSTRQNLAEEGFRERFESGARDREYSEADVSVYGVLLRSYYTQEARPGERGGSGWWSRHLPLHVLPVLT